jgi:phosphoribosylaminoimidazolecarboxamide formyltransferase/IMP cyclohydrolase
MNFIRIKTALISVYYKEGIVELAKFLVSNGVKIISTGGSYKLLKESGIEAIEISDFTHFPEIMSGRLKTLHPKIHGGLLGRAEDEEVMKEHDITKIDLSIVNLYPFEETVASGGTLPEIIEKIDIGGPSMVRSSAKNYKYTTVITYLNQYSDLKAELLANSFSTSLEFRERCASSAFALTGFYDSVISNWFSKTLKTQEALKSIPLRKKQDLRYGENPHQEASFWEIPLSTNSLAKALQLQGKELSYNNISDADFALEVASSFKEPAVCIVKHANPCGLATGQTLEEAYDLALMADPRSAFGGIVALNRKLDAATAEKIKGHFYEVIIAPEFSVESLQILSKKTNLRLLQVPNYTNEEGLMVKNIHGGLLIQNIDNHETEIELATGNVSEFKMEDLYFSFKAVKFFKSNAIVITKGTRVISFGCGQTSRVDAMEIACKKLALTGIEASTCILSSDAFFPFVDNLELAKSYGINVIIAPKGSIKDEEIKEYAKQNNITLFFAKSRHFRH